MKTIFMLASAMVLPQAPSVIPDVDAEYVSATSCCGPDCQCCEHCECGCRDTPRPTIQDSLTVATSLNTITFYTQANCPPCEAFKRNCLPELEKKGWHVKTVMTGTMSTPTFAYLGHQWTGYSTNGAFYDELERWIDVD